MKTTVLFAAVLLAHTASQAATVYECTGHNGSKTYSQSGGKNCTATNLGRPSVYTSAAPVYRESVPSESGQNQVRKQPASDLGAAERELQQAQQALEAGRNIRLGNERNYAKYLERVQGLENKVKTAREKVEAAKSGGSGQGSPE